MYMRTFSRSSKTARVLARHGLATTSYAEGFEEVVITQAGRDEAVRLGLIAGPDRVEARVCVNGCVNAGADHDECAILHDDCEGDGCTRCEYSGLIYPAAAASGQRTS